LAIAGTLNKSLKRTFIKSFFFAFYSVCRMKPATI